jgi:(S)-2-hydroxyglutarate dehydrogenase
MKSYDVVVVGGGIIGLATAREILKRQPDTRLAVLEKEPEIARHQSGHNSGVIHTGIYYAPGSMKAKACVAGHREMLAFCDERGIQYDLCGKVIVALDESELPRLQNLYERGIANGVQGLEIIGPERLRELEPYAAGIKAIYSPNTGIIDYRQVACAYADDIREHGGEIITNCKVTGLVERGTMTTLATTQGDIDAQFVITCGGLHSDRIAKMSGATDGVDDGVQIVPFRGDYYVLKPEKRYMCKGLIYPVPDPQFPFLGVHFTKTMRGEVWAGPNAVLAFAREGYGRWQVNPRDLGAALAFGGFWKLARQYWRTGMAEMYRDYSKGAYLTELRRYMPALRGEDLLPGPSGVRAQALSPDGKLVDDFLIKHGDRVAHVRNAPSPGATSSMVIARMIVDTVEQKIGVKS